MPKKQLVGIDPNQVPLNMHLGELAYLEKSDVWHPGNFDPTSLNTYLKRDGSLAMTGELASVGVKATVAGQGYAVGSAGNKKGGLFSDANGQPYLTNASAASSTLLLTDAGLLTWNSNDLGRWAPIDPATKANTSALSNYVPLVGGVSVTGLLTFTAGISVSSSLSLPGTGVNQFLPGTGDGASFTTHNAVLKGAWGLGLVDGTGAVKGYYDFKTGTLDLKGGYKVDGSTVWYSGNFNPASKADKTYADTIKAAADDAQTVAYDARTKANAAQASANAADANANTRLTSNINVWGTDSSGRPRTYFEDNSRTLIQGYGSGNVLEVWNGSSSQMFVVAAGGTVSAAGDVVANSDERLKENFKPFYLSLSDIISVESLTFDRTDLGIRQQGVKAQQVAAFMPLAVHTGANGYLAVDYGKIATTISLSLAKHVDKLEKANEDLRKRIERLEMLLLEKF